MQIIQHNPYRTLGLLVGATAAGQRRQTTRLQRFIEADIEPEEDFSFPVLGEFVRTVDLVNDAESKLNLNRDKMNAALFWFYKGNSITDEPAFDAMKSGDISEAVNIWIKLTSNGEISQRNASAFNNLGTLYLSGAFGDKNLKETQIERGVNFKLNFLESVYIDDLKILATDETFQTTKRELQIQFLNQIQAELEKSNIITLYEFVDIISEQKFIAKDDYLKNLAQQPIGDIERSIEESRSKRKTNKDGAIEIGKALLKQTSDKLKQVKTILGTSNLSYSSIADKLANEILQCSIEYFNYHQKTQSDFDYFKPVLELAENTDLIAVGKLTKDRIKDNISTLEETKINNLCFFCNKNIAVDSSAYKDTIYKETYRSPRYLPRRQVKFQKLEVTIPRCKDCEQIHTSSKGWLTRLPVILFAVIGLVLGLTIWGNWFLFLILGGFLGAFIGFIISSLDQSIKTEKSNIKRETSFSEFKPIKKLLSSGWTIYEPTP